MPEGAELLCVAMQGHQAQLWARVDPDAPVATRNIVVCATGENIPDGVEYVGTIFPDELVFHVFDLPAADPDEKAQAA